MNATILIRWGGIAAVAGGVLYSLYWILHPLVPAIVTTSSNYTAEHTIGLIGQILSLFGLLSIYARFASRAGWPGAIGFLLTFVGILSFFAVTATDAFVWPALAANPASRNLILTPANEFDQASAVFNSNQPLLLTGLIGMIFGGIALGVAIIRAKTFPRWAGLLLIIGSPLLAIGPALPMHDALPFNLLYFAPFALAMAGLGRTVWLAQSS